MLTLQALVHALLCPDKEAIEAKTMLRRKNNILFIIRCFELGSS